MGVGVGLGFKSQVNKASQNPSSAYDLTVVPSPVQHRGIEMGKDHWRLGSPIRSVTFQ